MTNTKYNNFWNLKNQKIIFKKKFIHTISISTVSTLQRWPPRIIYENFFYQFSLLCNLTKKNHNYLISRENKKLENKKNNTCSSNTSFMGNFVSPESVFIVTGKTVDHDGYRQSQNKYTNNRTKTTNSFTGNGLRSLSSIPN